MTADVATPRRPRAAIVQWLTIFHGMVEGAASLIASGMAGSVALLSFGFDSMIEVLSASIVLWRIVSLNREGRLAISERTGLRLVGICFLLLAAAIALDGGRSLIARERPHESVLGIVVAAASVIGMPILARFKRRISDEINSFSMKADARQTDFCAYLAAILLVGLVTYKAFGWWWADPVAALAMTPIILWEGIQALRGKSCGCDCC